MVDDLVELHSSGEKKSFFSLFFILILCDVKLGVGPLGPMPYGRASFLVLLRLRASEGQSRGTNGFFIDRILERDILKLAERDWDIEKRNDLGRKDFGKTF